ncbi:MAG: peptide-binding protein [Planctomycetes bacterium]|nr:peptide-binding protein [Planctomycetota bacterium]
MGRRYEAAILKIIPKEHIRAIHLSTIVLDSKHSFPDGKPSTSAEVIRRLKSRLPASLGILEYVKDESTRLAIKFLGTPKEMAAELGKFFANPDGEKKPFGKIVRSETTLFDNEPVITFKLHKNVRWHDGKPFTSADVKFTYDKLMDEKTQTVRRSDYELVKRVDTPDPYTVIVTYKKPFSPCLSTWQMGIIPKHILENQDINTSPFNRNPVGTGPFKFDEWISDVRVTVVANKDYFRGRPQLDRISWRVIPEAQLRMLEFQMEGVDYDGAQPHEFARLSKNPRFKLYERFYPGYTYIGWNEKREMFKDKRVRTALTYAINREDIVKYVLYGLGVISTGPYAPGVWYYNPNVKPLPYDPEKAKALLAEAGWRDTDGDGILDKNGKKFEFDLITNNGNPQRRDVAVLAQEQLKAVGIKANIYMYEWSVFISQKIDKRDFDACVLGWSLGYEPDLYQLWHSSQIEKGLNFCAYSNPEVDRLIEEGRTEFDRKAQKKIFFQIHKQIAADQPYTFLYVAKALPALHRGAFKIRQRKPDGSFSVKDIKMTPYGLTYYLEDWFRVSAPEMAAGP